MTILKKFIIRACGKFSGQRAFDVTVNTETLQIVDFEVKGKRGVMRIPFAEVLRQIGAKSI